ncbi:MAG TPA: PaaI family thioesterase [Geobacteraceae bacterium]|nr:PaaI family thioesterase [Geobacteraceae bacterium]
MYKKVYEETMTEGAPLPFKLPEWIACAPFEEYLGMRIEHAGEGRAILTMPFRVKLSQGKGLMHGGAVTALADTAVAMAIKSVLPEDSHFATVALDLKFHAPVRGGIVRAEARITERDERNIRGEAEVFDEKEVKVATFTSHFKVKKQRPETSDH